MIKDISVDNCDLTALENSFPQFLRQNSVKSDIINNTFTKYFTYVINTKIIAFINYSIIYDRAELINICVLEEYRNSGIASKLIDQMINDCKNNGVKNITLEVRIDNINAISLYKKYDFNEVSIRKGYYQGTDGIIMEKVVK